MTPKISIDSLLAATKIVPVIVINNLDDAVPLAEAMVEGGIPVLEVTLRTAVATKAIEAIAKAVPDAILGAGTVTSSEDLDRCGDAGAQFFVSPGATDDLLTNAEARNVTLLPGVATISEAMRATEHGFELLKFFPAEASGGAPVLKAWAGPLPGLRFCPTGGLGPKNVADYLALKNVACVGGSWMVSNEDIANKNWSAITKACQQAVALVTV